VPCGFPRPQVRFTNTISNVVVPGKFASHGSSLGKPQERRLAVLRRRGDFRVE
jgi:hypothetical protein